MHFDRRQLLFGFGACLSVPSRAEQAGNGSGGDPTIEAQSDASITIRDDLGERLTIKSPLARVVVFNRYTVEFVRAIAGTPTIVGIDGGVAREPAYWPGLQAVRVGEGQTSPNYEAIIALKPDAVFFPRNSEWAKARQILAPFRISVIVVTAWDVLKHEANVSLLGRLFEKEESASKLNAFYRHYKDLLATRTAGIPRKRVYFEEVGNYKTVLKGSGWHDMIETASGINIFGDVNSFDQPAARGNVQGFDIDPEDILARQPDLIVKLQPNQYEPHSKAFSAGVLNAIAARPGFADLEAVKNGRVYHMSYYLAGGCSKIVGALQLAKWRYPEQFGDIDPGEAMRTWLEDFQKVPYPGGYWVSLVQIRQ